MNGRVLLDEIEDRFGLTFEESDDVDTIAGWIHLQSIEEVQEGDEVKHGEYVWSVEKMDNHSRHVDCFSRIACQSCSCRGIY